MFLRYYAGTPLWALKILSLTPVFLGYVFGIIDRNQVKAYVIRRFFKNQPVDKVQSKAREFAEKIIPGLIRPDAQSHLDALQSRGQTLYLCSASISPYLNFWASSQNIQHVLATEMEENDLRYTGEIAGWNIWGAGKVRRIYDHFGSETVRILEAFGDSRGDKEMLHAADVSHWRPFRLTACE